MISILFFLTNQQLLFLRLDLHSKSCLHQGKPKFRGFSKWIYGLTSKEKKKKSWKGFFIENDLVSIQIIANKTHSYTFAVTLSPPSPAPTLKCSMLAVSLLLYDFFGGEGGQEQQDIPDRKLRINMWRKWSLFFSPGLIRIVSLQQF